MPTVAVAVLGQVGVLIDGAASRLPGRRERVLLGVLAAHRGQVVSTDRLIEEVWGDRAPESARSSLQVAVSRLRSVLEPDRRPGAESAVLASASNGYVLRLAPDAVDADRFSGLVREAHDALGDGRPDVAAGLADAALALWTGEPYSELTGELGRTERARLEEQRQGLAELRAQAYLDSGRAALALGDLEGLLAAHPFRERAWCLLATALYRTGRQADALAAVSRARKVLVDELGVDPSPELQRLEQAILTQDVLLDGPSPTRASAPPQQVDSAGPRGEARAIPAQVDADMVGREAAVAMVESLVADLVAGRGTTLVVTGEAGIGKTRLVTTAALLAAREGAEVLWGRCHEADVAPAYWPWISVLRELRRDELPPPVAALLSADPVAEVADAQSMALRTYDAAARLLEEESQDRPLVVIIEDLHWADAASLQLLAYAAEQLVRARVLLIGTIRVPDAVPAGLQACLAALGRLGARRTHLTGLGSDEVRRLVEDTFAHGVDAELASVLAERTDGNPFFVLELVRLLTADSRLHVAGAQEVAVPEGVQDVLRLRVSRLPEDVQRLLTVAAVCGRTFDRALVASVAGSDSEHTLTLLEQALDAQVIEEDDQLDRYRFTHALVRETLYDGLSRTRRGGLHAACGSLLEGRLAARPELVAEVAHHQVLGAALRSELAPAAARHAVLAAQQAEGRGALDQALVHWQQALTADDLTTDSDSERRFDILLGLGRARYRQGDVAGSRDALDAAVRLASESGDIERMALAATSFRGAGVWHWREFGTSDPAMVAVLETCRQRLPDGPLRARVLASLGMELVYEWRSVEGEGFSSASMKVARTVADPEVVVDVGCLRHLLMFGRPGSSQELIALAEELLSLPLTQEQELYVRFFAANAHLQAAETPAADDQASRCNELTRRLRHTGADVPLAWWHFYRAVARADDHADTLLARALELHRRSSVVGFDDMGPMARIRLQGFGAPVPLDLIERARAHANPAFRAFVAHALAEAGDPDAGLPLLGDAVPDGAWDYASTYGDCLRVDVLAAAGHLDALPAALARIEPWQDETAVFGSTDCIGALAYFVGRGREALGELDAARAAYRQAIDVNSAANIRPWLRRAEMRSRALGDKTINGTE